MKVFISQPMRGLSDDEIKANREKAMDLLTLKYNGDVEFVDSYVEEDAPKDSNQGAYYLRRSIEIMSSADAVAFLPGYDKARGCMIEYTVARQYEFNVIVIDDNYKGVTECRYLSL